MSEGENQSSNWNKSPKGFSFKKKNQLILAWVVTFFVFCVLAVFILSFSGHIPYYWRSCSSTFPGSNFLTVMYYTVQSSFFAALNDYSIVLFNPTYWFAAFSTAIYGTLRGKPPFIVPAIAWLTTDLIFAYFSISNLDTTVDEIMAGLPYDMLGFLLVIPCWLVSKRFW